MHQAEPPSSDVKSTVGNWCIIKSLINVLIQSKILHSVLPTGNGFFSMLYAVECGLGLGINLR